MVRNSLHAHRRFERAFSLIEAMIAVIVLTIAFLAFSTAMIGATQAENKAATHTRAMEAANYMLEVMRRDNEFWTPFLEYQANPATAPCTTISPACWSGTGTLTDDCGNTYPPYDDTYSTNFSTWHTACINGLTSNAPIPPANPITLQYIWRADPHNAWTGSSNADPNLADLSVWVYITIDGRQELYHVTGMNRYE